jgi:putative transposase
MRDPLLRLLYVGIGLLLRNVWVWLHWQVLAHRHRGGRRINLGSLSFRKMLVWLQYWAEARLGIQDEIDTERRMYE